MPPRVDARRAGVESPRPPRSTAPSHCSQQNAGDGGGYEVGQSARQHRPKSQPSQVRLAFRGKSADDVIAATPWVIEGIPTTKSVRELARRHDVEMPITEAVHAVLFEGKDVIATLSELMGRKLKGEA